jgi:tetratricopeptide (TPR) repeat protein
MLFTKPYVIAVRTALLFILPLAVAAASFTACDVYAEEANAAIFFKKGLKLAEQGRYEEALEMYREGLEINPEVETFITLNNPEAIRYCNEAKTSKNLSLAISNFEKASRLEPGNPFIYREMGATYAANGRIDEAVESFKKALSLVSNYLVPVVDLGFYLTRAERHEEAYFWNRLHLILDPETFVREEVLKDIERNKDALNL